MFRWPSQRETSVMGCPRATGQQLINLSQIAFVGVPFDGWLRPSRRSHPDTGPDRGASLVYVSNFRSPVTKAWPAGVPTPVILGSAELKVFGAAPAVDPQVRSLKLA
jgi:hypothetical protein